MQLEANAWERDWCHALIRGHANERRMPENSQQFLVTFGLPRVVLFEWRNAFELSFAPLEKELVTYNTMIRWGDFYDGGRDREWRALIRKSVFST